MHIEYINSIVEMLLTDYIIEKLLLKPVF